MKESEEMHLKSTIYESTLSTATRSPLPHVGKAYAERRFASIFYKRAMPESAI